MAQTAALQALLAQLDSEQREAMIAPTPLLIAAGAGTGKTRTLTARYASVCQQEALSPHEMMAVTFTHKAAHEMKQRIRHLMNWDATQDLSWIGTFHSLSALMLRQHGEAVGLPSCFTILDRQGQWRLIKHLLHQRGYGSHSPQDLLDAIEYLRNRNVSADLFSSQPSWNQLLREKLNLSSEILALVPSLYRSYEAHLSEEKQCDFSGLILKTVQLFQEHADIRAFWQNRFAYLFVDEYQDTNTAQQAWLMHLAQPNHRIVCVGDENQRIYGWRGAEAHILTFNQLFPGGNTVFLTHNYRSTGHIVEAASGVISHNSQRISGKKLRSQSEEGKPVQVHVFRDGLAEAKGLVDCMQKYQTQGHPWTAMALMVRASHQTRAFEEALRSAHIPYTVIGGTSFYEKAESVTVLAYLRLVTKNHYTFETSILNDSFEHMLITPKRGIGPMTLFHLKTYAESQKTALWLQAAQTWEKKAAMREVLGQIEAWQALAAKVSPQETFREVMQQSGYRHLGNTLSASERQAREDVFLEWESLLGRFSDWSSFWSFMEEQLMSPEATEGVSLMTIHSAKGLEYEIVFLPGWEEGLFPHRKSLQDDEQLEEERRLAYVAITRAKKELHISWSKQRAWANGHYATQQPSRFLTEIPKKNTCSADSKPFSHIIHQVFEKPGKTFGSNPSHAAQDSYRLGRLVLHPLFGEGKIIRVQGDTVYVSFTHYGEKQLLNKFLTLL